MFLDSVWSAPVQRTFRMPCTDIVLEVDWQKFCVCLNSIIDFSTKKNNLRKWIFNIKFSWKKKILALLNHVYSGIGNVLFGLQNVDFLAKAVQFQIE